MKKTSFILSFILFAFLNLQCENPNSMVILEDGEESNSGRVPFSLEQNYPNPAHDYTNINFSVSSAMRLSLKIYTEDYYHVSTIWEKEFYPGIYHATYDLKNKNGKPLPSGDYYYVLEGSGFTLMRLMKIAR